MKRSHIGWLAGGSGVVIVVVAIATGFLDLDGHDFLRFIRVMTPLVAMAIYILIAYLLIKLEKLVKANVTNEDLKKIASRSITIVLTLVFVVMVIAGCYPILW